MYNRISFEGAAWEKVGVPRGEGLLDGRDMGMSYWWLTSFFGVYPECRAKMSNDNSDKGKQGWRTGICGVILSKVWRRECNIENGLAKEQETGCVNVQVEFCVRISGHIAQVLKRIPLEASLLGSVFSGQFLSSSRDRLLRVTDAMCFFLEMAFWRWQEVTFRAVPHRKAPARQRSVWMRSPWLGASGEPSRWQRWFLQLQWLCFTLFPGVRGVRSGNSCLPVGTQMMFGPSNSCIQSGDLAVVQELPATLRSYQKTFMYP